MIACAPLRALSLFALLALSGCASLGERADIAHPAPPAPVETALDVWVRAPDPVYAVRLERKWEGSDHRAYLIEMTSQAWPPSPEVGQTQWLHWLTIVVPDRRTGETALLRIGGGRNDRLPPTEPKGELVRLAVASESVVAEVRQVPNQPLVLVGAKRPLTEDALIAFAWERFLRTGDATWLPRLPMTKAAVRAMDTVTSFCAKPENGGIEVRNFVVTGESKRGWTAWTTAAVDPRVVAVAPHVIDLLNLQKSFEHHHRVYGFWSPAIDEFIEMGIPDWFGTPEFRALEAIEDPYSYRMRLTMPKYIVNAVGDPFFLPDSWRLYFDDLIGPKWLRYVPNADHSLNGTDVLEGLLAFQRAIASERPLPELRWQLDGETLTVRSSGPEMPSRVVLWQAHNPDARDFRASTLGSAWTETPLESGGASVWKLQLETPARGWTAYFVELSYADPQGRGPALKFTTGVHIVPDTLDDSLERE